MKLTRLVLGAFALLLLLPLRVAGEHIAAESYDCTYTYDYGEVEVTDVTSSTFSVLVTLGPVDDFGASLEGASSFEITDISMPINPDGRLWTGDTVEVEVAFAPESLGEHTAFLEISTNAANYECNLLQGDLYYTLTGTGADYVPTPEELMTALLEFFDGAVESGEIVGVGATPAAANAHLRVFANRLDSALSYIQGGEDEQACEALEWTLLRSDNATPDRPKDFIGGTEAESLNTMILEVMTALGC